MEKQRSKQVVCRPRAWRASFVTALSSGHFVLTFLFILMAMTGMAQSRVLRGAVYDNQRTPLAGVNVLVPGTTIGTATDVDGRFSLEVPPNANTLAFSYIGYVDKTVIIGNQAVFEVTLDEDAEILEEVVVVGYGVQKKSDITGSVASANTQEMLKITTTDLGKMLVGRVAGVEVNAADGRPGSVSSIRIRGTRSLSGGNDPLYVVDGVPLTDVSTLNPADIASLEVLKDASATAIYGARAANGVILITTKRGETGRTVFNFSTRQNIQMLKRNFDFYTPEGYVALQREKFRRTDGTYVPDAAIFQPWELDNLANQRYTNWEDLSISDALLSRYDFSVRTGTDRSKMLLSVGYNDQNGMISNSGYKQINTRLNADQKLSDKFTVGANIAYANTNRDIEEEFFEGYLGMSPLASPFDANGKLLPVTGDGGQNNPLWNNTQYFHTEKRNNYLVNLFSDWKVFPGLTYRLNLSLNGDFNNTEVYRSSLHQLGSNTKGTGNIGKGQTTDAMIENILTYVQDLKQLGRFDLTFVQSANQIRTERLSIGATQFPTDLFGAKGIGGALAPGQPSISIVDRKIASYMGRLNYSLKDKYLVSFTMRADGSSVFGANNKWAYLPSAAAAWLLHREAFLSDISWLSFAKLRFSYGQVGNQAVTPYRTLGVANEYFYKFGANEPANYSALPSSELFNPNLKWEVSESRNIGFDLGLFDNRLSLNAEFYNTETKDLIVRRRIDASLGYTSMFDNLGQVRNRGVELTMGYDLIRQRDFRWNIAATYTRNRNEIIKIAGDVDANGNPIDDLVNNWFIGRSINVYFDYKFDGIWQATDNIADSHMPTAKPGDIRVADVDGNGTLTSADRIVYDRDPNFIASFTSTLNFKGLDFSMDFFWRQGGTRFNGNYAGGLGGGASNAMNIGYWTPENMNPNLPRPQPNFIPFTGVLQLQDATFFRLRNATLGYTLPASLLNKVNVSDLRIYASMTNFWTVTNFLSYGPEHSAGDYPEPKMLEFGLNLNF